MPQYAACLDSALFGVVRGSKEGLQNEGEIFFKLVQSPTAKSLIHVFFAERATTKVDIPNDGAVQICPEIKSCYERVQRL